MIEERIGYDAAAELANEAFRTGRTIRDLATERAVAPPGDLSRLLDARRMTGE